MDLGTKTIREILVEKLGKEKADSVLKKINEGYEPEMKNDDLKRHVQSVFTEEGVEQSLAIADVFFATPAGA